MEEDADADEEEERNGLRVNLTQDCIYVAKKRTREKSLGQLCQQFITLFLTWSPILSLEQAASQISPQTPVDDHTMKTRVLLLLLIS
jgi:hypothetical protein